MDDSLRGVLRAAITSFAGRIVLAVYTLVVVPLLPAFINFTNGILGYDLTDVQVNHYASQASLALGGLAAIWLLNNGLFERAAVKAKTLLDSVNTNAEDVKTDYIKGP